MVLPVTPTKRILLLEPPFLRLFKGTYSLDRFPLSLGYLAGAIKTKTDWDVKAFNADFSPDRERIQVRFLTGAGFQNYRKNLGDPSSAIWQEIKSVILKHEPAVIGISAKSQNYKAACVVARLVKEINKDILVVLGGPHPSLVGADVLRSPDIDISVRGEGEKTVADLLEAIDGKKGLEAIPGIYYKKGGQIFENPFREYMEDLDSLSFPHQFVREVLIDFEKYPLSAFKNIFATRGCPFNCFYCGSRNIWGRRVRFRSPENVVEEIKGLRRMGLRTIHFDDDTFGINKEYTRNLLHAMRSDLRGLKWSCEVHVQLIDEETVDLMKAAGCYLIQVGVESGNDRILETVRKNITIAEALEACAIIKERNIEVQTFFIVGFPQETEETLRDTFAAMRKIKSDSLIYNIFTPYPGTEAFEYCREKGLIDKEFDVSLYNHQSPNNCFCLHMDLADFRRQVLAIEKYIDRKNISNRIKRFFSWNLLWRITEKGIKGSIQEGLKVLNGK